MRRLFEFLLTPQDPLWRYCLYAAPLAMVPSLALSAVARIVFEAAGFDLAAHEAPMPQLTAVGVFGTVVFAPVVESLLLAGLLKLLSSTSLRPAAQAGISAVLWGGAHGLHGALWFFGTAWSFFVLSCAYMAWRRSSFRLGYLAALAPHVLVNAVALCLVWSDAL